MNRSRTSLVLVVATFMIALAGCQGDGGTGPREKILTIAATSPVELSGTVGTPVTPAPVVRVTDSEGNPAANVTVIFSATAGSGRADPGTVVTDANGQATTVWSLGAVVSLAKHTMTARVGALPPVVFAATAVADAPELVSAAAGATQIGAVGSVAGSPLKAFVGDRFGNPVAGVPVSFSVVAGGGSIDAASVATDSAGLATAGPWTLGPVTGVQTVRADAAGASVTFAADTYDCSQATDAAACVGLGELVFDRPSDGQIYRIHADGSFLTRLTNDGFNHNAVWSPDGRRIAFIRYTPGSGTSPGPSDIYVMNADGSNVKRRTTNGFYQSVSWSPDGKELAVAGYPLGSDYSQIFILKADDDATPPLLLTTDAASPAWSPVGTRILFYRGTGYYDVAHLYLINRDGTDSHPIFGDVTETGWAPAWSPDGQKISFAKCVSGCTAYVVNVDGSHLRQIPGTGSVSTTAWSPDGKWLALSSWDEGLVYVPVEGGIPRMITIKALNPSWRPPVR